MLNLILHPIDSFLWWANTPLTESTGMMYPLTSLFFLLLPGLVFFLFLCLSHQAEFPPRDYTK